MKDIKTSNIAKGICYILIPILVLIIIINSFSLMFYIENEEDFMDYNGYANTEKFADNYFSNIMRAVNIVEYEKEEIEARKKVEITDVNTTVNANETGDTTLLELNPTDASTTEATGGIQYNFSTIKKYDVVLIAQDGTIITNIQKTNNTDTQEELKEYISSKPYFWKYDGKNIETNVNKLSYDQLEYNELEQIQASGYQIYISFNDVDSSEFYIYNLLYNFVGSTYQGAPAIIMISSILLIVACAYIIISIGHKAGHEEIYTNALDKIPYEIIAGVTIILLTLEIYVLVMFLSVINNISGSIGTIDISIMMSIFMGIIIYATLAICGVTTIRRIKAHIFWKNTIFYKFFKFILGGLFINLSQTVKLAVEYGGFILASVILGMITLNSPIFILVLLGFWYYIYKKILNNINQMNKVREKIHNMYNGNIEKPLNEQELYGELRQVARELNDISGGLSNAIEEATKSERLKTELITNVSHDIKTPLTSIINYVDLMKQEEIGNPKIKEYLNVLDNKSQRLKKLTEDLIEASKASSGNIKLTMEKLNVKELIKQVGGEFEDRFKKKGLQIIESFPDEDISIQADSRYMYRVMENMYMNISKYALENSRVYIDVTKTKDKVQIVLKNISKDKLNITVDELMQRFVRGDASRTTEGSGLGISIAKSLTELQKGKFNIYLDGDLFKVVIEFELK